eukprot:2736832-Rhodomonas_salina.1
MMQDVNLVLDGPGRDGLFQLLDGPAPRGEAMLARPQPRAPLLPEVGRQHRLVPAEQRRRTLCVSAEPQWGFPETSRKRRQSGAGYMLWLVPGRLISIDSDICPSPGSNSLPPSPSSRYCEAPALDPDCCLCA